MAGDRYAYNAGPLTNAPPEIVGGSISLPDEKKAKARGNRQAGPELGGFILLGTGLLTLAGWGRRKFRK